MKKIALLLFFLPSIVVAQETNDFSTKRIEVWGEASRTIIPNEIFTIITLKEYKAPGKTVKLNDLERQLVRSLKRLDIPEKDLRVENIYGYNWDWKKKKSDEFLASKSFELKTSDVKQLNDLLASLDPEGLSRVNVKNYTHSDLKKIEQELQLEALQNAQRKAKNLVNGIGEALGSVLQVQEIQGNDYQYRSNVMMNARAESANYQSDVDFKNIEITAKVRAIFEIE